MFLESLHVHLIFEPPTDALIAESVVLSHVEAVTVLHVVTVSLSEYRKLR